MAGRAPKPDSDDGTASRERRRFEERLRRRIAEIYSANPWLIATGIDQGATRQAARIQAVADTSVLAVGARTGVGPNADGVQLLSLGLPSTGSIMGDEQTAVEALVDPGPEVLAAIDAWDPDGEARVIGGLLAVDGTIAGRRTFGARQQAWADLEDKLKIESVWVGAGVPTVPSAQVASDDAEALLAAHDRLATENGTVWAGDNAQGSHGGGEGTFWVPTRDAVMARQRSLQGFGQVRVMPFIEGIPCSIHGMVIPDGAGGADVVVFRPMEMMILRDAARHRFVYARSGSRWDAEPEDRRAMRSVAAAIGRELHRRVEYRGTFTVDGVMGSGGFLPTEVNTRFGAALASEMATLDGSPIDLHLLHLALIQDVPVGPALGGTGPDGPGPDRAAVDYFEQWVTANLDRNRGASSFLEIEAVPEQERLVTVSRDPDGGLVVTDIDSGTGRADKRHEVAEVRWGTARNRGMLMVAGGPAIPTGPPTAPLMIEVLEAVDRHWDLGLPRLTAARPVRCAGRRR